MTVLVGCDFSSTPTRRMRELMKRPPVIIYADNSLREAADLMVSAGIGRLPVVTRADPRTVSGIITRSDLLSAHRRRLDEAHHVQRGINLRIGRRFAWAMREDA